tara:strand:- start:285 stop:461 length:177 start_codon:yes stop_codon:yes gene_type:complete
MNLKIIFYIVILISIFGFVGQMDFESEIVAEQQYIKDVCSGVYPDYKYLEPNCMEEKK